MNLDIKTTQEDSLTTVNLLGSLDSNTASLAEKEINLLIENGAEKIIINLEKTDYVSSAGLRVFLSTAKKLMVKNGSVKLCKPNEVVTEILEITGFNTIIDVFSSYEDALKA
ncbi:STAS domain-containing protein [Flavobacteriaceae bacterium]|nr:STAS domain-containing protein [Flavobacteriaceae bacterium]